MTTEQFLQLKGFMGSVIDREDIPTLLIEFAQHHVQTALTEASVKAKLHAIPGAKYKGPLQMIKRSTILEAYPLENIK